MPLCQISVPVHWNGYGESGPLAHLAVHFNIPLHLVDFIIYDVEPKPASFLLFLCGEKRVKNVFFC